MEDAKDDEDIRMAMKKLPQKRNHNAGDEDTLDAQPIKKTKFQETETHMGQTVPIRLPMVKADDMVNQEPKTLTFDSSKPLLLKIQPKLE